MKRLLTGIGIALTILLTTTLASAETVKGRLIDSQGRELGTVSNPLYITGVGTSSDLSPWLTDTGNVYLETSTLNVGIGTLTPSGKLGVKGDVTITGGMTVTGVISASNDITTNKDLSARNVSATTNVSGTNLIASADVTAPTVNATAVLRAGSIVCGTGTSNLAGVSGDLSTGKSLTVSNDLDVLGDISSSGGVTFSSIISPTGTVYYAVVTSGGILGKSATVFGPGGGSGSGTVNSGAENAMAYFSAAGTAVSGNTDVLASFRGLTISDVLTANGAVYLGPNSFEATVEADGDSTYAFYVTDAATTKVMELSEIGVTFGVPLLSNVGIGMASPQAVLDLSPAAVSATTEIVRIRNVSQNDVLHVDIKGNVGIGSVSPQAVLDLSPSAKMTTTPIFLSRTLSAVETMRILTNGRIKLQSDGSTIPSGATQPANVGAGELWIDTDTQGLCIGT